MKSTIITATCIMCNSEMVIFKHYRYNYRSHLCEECGIKMMEKQKIIYNFYKEPIVKYSEKYGYSIRASFYRTRIYGMYRSYKEDKNLIKLIDLAMKLKPNKNDIYIRRFIQRELLINYKIFFGDEKV